MLNTGDFCWAELYSYDIENALKFYTALFSWNIEPLSIGQDISYKLIKVKDKGIAGGIRINEQMKTESVPPHWNSYVLVNDVSAIVVRAKQLGAALIRDVWTIENKGKMAIILDPTGASLSLWQPADVHQENGSMPEKFSLGAICWHELITNDMEKAAQFYVDLFGWAQQKGDFLPQESYIKFVNREYSVAGMLKPVANRNNPGPRWSIYFSVVDLDACMNIAKKLGGQVCYAPVEILNMGRFVTLCDPEGIYFSVLEVG